MQVIYVYFRDLKIGELTFDGTNYIYNINQEGIDAANSRGYFLSLYKCKNSFVSPILPNSFKELVLDDESAKLYPEANIVSSDNDFMRLYKFAKLKDIVRPDFYFVAD